MNCIFFLLSFKKVISSHFNTHEQIYNLNHSMMSLLEDKKRKDNDVEIQIRSNKRLRNENKIDMTADIDKGKLNLESEKLSAKELQIVASTNEELEQCKTIKRVSMYDSAVKPLTNNYNSLMDAYCIETTSFGSTEPLDLSCKSKNNLASSLSNARSLGGADLYNFIRTDDMDKKVDSSFPEALKNTINTNVNKFQNTGVDTNTSEVLKCTSMMSCFDCEHSFFAPHCSTIYCVEQELSKLFDKLEKKFFNLVQARNLPEFNQICFLDARNMPDNDIFCLRKIRLSYYDKLNYTKRKIENCITIISEQLKYQQIPMHRYNLIGKVINFTIQVFAFINDFNFYFNKKLFNFSNVSNRLRYQQYKFTTFFSDSSLKEMITLVEKLLCQDSHFDHVKGADLKKNLESLGTHIVYIIEHLKFYIHDLNEYKKIFMNIF